MNKRKVPLVISYCVVVTRRSDNTRLSITGPTTKEKSELDCKSYNSDCNMRRLYKYFKVSKHPYKTIIKK